jgi:LmbE family N-acetylglucosaminyl deacetylase
MPLDPQPPLKPKVVLGICAHPDDLDFGASGTLAKFARDGADVYYCIVTDGSKGSPDHDMTPEKLQSIRETEQRDAARIIGAKDVFFLKYPDGELEVTMKLKKDIVTIIRTVKPDTVITMDPTVIYSQQRGIVNHPDHRAAGQATLDAVFPLARDHLSFPELFEAGLEPHKVKHVLLIHFDTATYFVDISDTFGTKLEALAKHVSQVGDMKTAETWLRAAAEETGNKAGYGKAEGFVRLDLRI